MKDPTIYLAGPMTGLTYEEISTWRNKADKFLRHVGWHVLSPVTDKMATDHPINDDAKRDTEHRPIVRTSSAFVSQDIFYVKHSDAILANFTGAKKVSLGTIWELGVADALGKMIVSVIEPGSVHDHSFVRRRSSLFVPTMDEALEYLSIIPQK